MKPAPVVSGRTDCPTLLCRTDPLAAFAAPPKEHVESLAVFFRMVGLHVRMG